MAGDFVGFMFNAQTFHASPDSPELAPIAYTFDVFASRRVALLYADREEAFTVGSSVVFTLINSPIDFQLDVDVTEDDDVMCFVQRRRRKRK